MKLSHYYNKMTLKPELKQSSPAYSYYVTNLSTPTPAPVVKTKLEKHHIQFKILSNSVL